MISYNNSIKVGYLVSYDYYYIFTSIKTLYNYVDEIFLAIDINYKTWSGNPFEIPSQFFDEIKSLDIDNKIQFYYDIFYMSHLTPMECETRERNLLQSKMGRGWKIQLDVDEYIFDFIKLRRWLKKNWFLNIFPIITPVVLRGRLITLIKDLDQGILYVENEEIFSLASNIDRFIKARNNKNVTNFYLNLNVIHQSWARSDPEIKRKINNWGHRDDFNTDSFFDLWKSLNETNYMDFINFHPLSRKTWNKLNYSTAGSIDLFITNYEKEHPQNLYYLNSTDFLKILKRGIFNLLKNILKK